MWSHRCPRAPFATKINHFRLLFKGLGKWGCDHIQKTVWWWKVSISKERRHKKKKKKKEEENPTIKEATAHTHTHTHTHTHILTHTYAHTHTYTLITPDRPLVQTHQFRSAFSAGCVKRAIKVYTEQLATTRCTSEAAEFLPCRAARPAMKLTRSSKNLVLLFSHKVWLYYSTDPSWIWQLGKRKVYVWSEVRIVLHTSHKPMYKANEDGFKKVRKKGLFNDALLWARCMLFWRACAFPVN